MVLHPAGLEGSILAVIAEHQEARTLRVVNHVLSEDMYIGDVRRAHRTCGLSISTSDPSAVRPAGDAAGQVPRAVLLASDRVLPDHLAGRSALEALRDVARMDSSAIAA